MNASAIATRIKTFASQPLIIAQGVTSLYGLVGTVAAANILDSSQFVVFTVLTLAQLIAGGVALSLVGEPSLVVLRREPDARSRFRHLLVCLIPIALLTFGVSTTSASLSWPDAAAVSLVTSVHLIHQWLRIRAMAVRRFALILVGDCLRLVCVLLVASTLLVGKVEISGVTMQYLYLACAVPPCLLLLAAPDVRKRAWTPYKTFAGLARWQFVEYGVAQVQTTAPLLLIAAQSDSPLVGAFRLAQTLTGPANLLFLALATNFLALAATSGGRDREVVSQGKQVARRVTVATGAALPVFFLVAVLFPGLFPAVDPGDLILSLLCVGLCTWSTASAAIHAVVLRALYLQRKVATLRVALTLTTWVGFAVGYAIDGVSGSLVGGFLACAVANPLLFSATAQREYRRRLTAPDDAHDIPAASQSTNPR